MTVATQAQILQLSVHCMKLKLLVQADEKVPANPEFEAKHSRYPAGHPNAGQFAPKQGAGGGTGTATAGTSKDVEKAVSTISSRLDQLDPETIQKFQKLVRSPEVAELGKELAGAVAMSEAKHDHGGGVGETLKAVGLGAVFDLGVTKLIPEVEKLGELENETEAAQQMGKVAAKTIPPMLVLFSNLAPEILVGESMAHALPTALVQMGVVMGVSGAAEEQLKKYGLEPNTGNATADEIISTAVEVAIMGATSVTTREAWMKIRKSSKLKLAKDDGKSLSAVLDSRKEVMDRVKEQFDQGQMSEAKKLVRSLLPESAVTALAKVSSMVPAIVPASIKNIYST